jgi:type IV pilus assembly protein PilY1
VYGGDLNGRVWRFDVSDPNPANWTTAHFATVTDPSGVPQPITTAPQIEIDLNNGTDRYVFIGTGRLLDTSDLTTPSPAQTQSMYSFRDGTLTTPRSTGLPIIPRSTMAVASGTAAIAGGAPNGWYEDLSSGQRIVTDVVADLNVVAYVGTDIQPDPCLTSLPAYIYAREYVSAVSLIEVGGVPAPYAYASEGAVGIELVGLDSPSSSFPVMSLVYSKETTGGLAKVKIVNPNISGGHRLSWRLIGEQ